MRVPRRKKILKLESFNRCRWRIYGLDLLRSVRVAERGRGVHGHPWCVDVQKILGRFYEILNFL